jgi:hypothetical protein
MGDAADTSPGVQVPDDDGGGVPQPAWIPDVVSLGTMGSGSGGGDVAGTRSLASWLGW